MYCADKKLLFLVSIYMKASPEQAAVRAVLYLHIKGPVLRLGNNIVSPVDIAFVIPRLFFFINTRVSVLVVLLILISGMVVRCVVIISFMAMCDSSDIIEYYIRR